MAADTNGNRKTRTVTINVTAEDIAMGKRRKCDECPIALASYRALGCPVRVFPYSIALNDGSCRTAMLGDVPSAFIHSFDEAYPVHPFSFDIDVPTEVA